MINFYLYIQHPNTLEQYVGVFRGKLACLREFKYQVLLHGENIEMKTYKVK